MDITVALLIYKSVEYLDFVMDSLNKTHSEIHDVRYLIVCNDATDEVIVAAKEHELGERNVKVVVHENENKDDWWIQNVYNAWNRCIEECETDYICFVNSDMYFSKGWLDELARIDLDKFIPTPRLVESGRMPSITGLISKNFGQKLGEFKADEFETYANSIKENLVTLDAGAFMPSLFKTETLRSVGGWSKNQGNYPGDRITFEILRYHYGLRHIMLHNSIVYHFQRGESSEVGDA